MITMWNALLISAAEYLYELRHLETPTLNLPLSPAEMK